jgi:hypothetical protein
LNVFAVSCLVLLNWLEKWRILDVLYMDRKLSFSLFSNYRRLWSIESHLFFALRAWQSASLRWCRVFWSLIRWWTRIIFEEIRIQCVGLSISCLINDLRISSWLKLINCRSSWPLLRSDIFPAHVWYHFFDWNLLTTLWRVH